MNAFKYSSPAYKAQYDIYSHVYELGRFFQKHNCLFMLLHVQVCWFMALSGPKWLERVILNYFWSVILMLFLTPVANGYYKHSRWEWLTRWNRFAHRWRVEYYGLSLLVNIVIVPAIIWRQLLWVDIHVAHHFRNWVGQEVSKGIGHPLGLEGQNLFFAGCVLGLLLLLGMQELFYYAHPDQNKHGREQQRRTPHEHNLLLRR